MTSRSDSRCGTEFERGRVNRTDEMRHLRSGRRTGEVVVAEAVRRLRDPAHVIGPAVPFPAGMRSRHKWQDGREETELRHESRP